MRSRSDSDPTRIPTRVSGTSEGGNVGAVAHAVEMYASGSRVGGITRVGDRIAEPGHVENPAAVRHEPAVVERRAGVEDEGARRLGVLDTRDRCAGVTALR